MYALGILLSTARDRCPVKLRVPPMGHDGYVELRWHPVQGCGLAVAGFNVQACSRASSTSFGARKPAL